MENTEEEALRLTAEFMAKLAARTIKATHDLATLGIPGLLKPGYLAPIGDDV